MLQGHPRHERSSHVQPLVGSALSDLQGPDPMVSDRITFHGATMEVSTVPFHIGARYLLEQCSSFHAVNLLTQYLNRVASPEQVARAIQFLTKVQERNEPSSHSISRQYILDKKNELNVVLPGVVFIIVDKYSDATMRSWHSVGCGILLTNSVITAKHVFETGPNESVKSVVVLRDLDVYKSGKWMNPTGFSGRACFAEEKPLENLNQVEMKSLSNDVPVCKVAVDVDVTVLRLHDPSNTFRFESFYVPSPDENQSFCNKVVCCFGSPGVIYGAPIKAKDVLTKSLYEYLLASGIQEDELNSFASRVTNNSFYADQKGDYGVVCHGFVSLETDGFLISTMPCLNGLSGAPVVLIDNPKTLIGMVIGASASGLTVIMSFRHPAFQEAVRLSLL